MGSRAERFLLTVRNPRRPKIEIFGKGTVRGTQPLLPPGLCWICDNTPQQEAERVIDTMRNARPGQTALHVTERKYVCENCARELGKFVGMVDRPEFEKVVDELRDADLLLKRLETELTEARASQTRVVSIDEVKAELKPKAPARKAAPSAS